MRKRVLSFLLAASAAFCFICSSAPEVHAIVPIGLVQSALASYVTSAGYKMWSENGGGDLMVEALSNLYQSWLDSTDPVGALTLGQMSENDYVYLDTSGQIVIRKAAADLFQQFSDWIQTEYSVPVGSDTPIQVVSPVPGAEYVSNDNGFFAYILSNSSLIDFDNNQYYRSSTSYAYYNGYPVYLLTDVAVEYYFCTYNLTNGATDRPYIAWWSISGKPTRRMLIVYYDGSSYQSIASVPANYWASSWYNYGNTFTFDTWSINPTYPSVINPSLLDSESSVSVAGLGVTLAQAVADVVGQAKEDDAVVIGVGASAGATAQDIADMVAQGVKAQTLDPSVSITAEAVIDTPVQPYPDIDGLGLPTLGAALVDRFPFCIPWDFVDTVKLLSADPQPINIKVDLIPQRIKTSVGITSDTSFDIDLSGEQYAKIGVFCRWGSLITFCFGLFLLTKRLVWTA